MEDYICNSNHYGVEPFPSAHPHECRPLPSCGLRTQVLPSSVGTDASGQPYAPTQGAYINTIVRYEANGAIYIYDQYGTFTPFIDPYNKVTSVNGKTGDVELGTLTLQINGETLAEYNGLDAEMFDVHVPEYSPIAKDEMGYARAGEVFNYVEALQTNINMEVNARESDRDNLQTNINAEVNTREEQYNELSTRIDNISALAQAYAAEEKGTTLYEGTASVNNITLSESGLNYDHLIVVAEYMGMGSSAIKQQVSAVFYPTDAVKAFQMTATDITVGDAPAQTTVQDIWSISDDGTELDLASSTKAELVKNGSITFDVTPEMTSMFTITKVVGFGKKQITG